MREIIVIGAGASGMAAAIAAAEAGAKVIVVEQNEKPGKKIYITGKGRCNLTNAADMETVRANVVTNPKFLYSAFSAFDNRDIMRLLEEEGCPVKVERGNRVFPVSDHASDVTAALKRRMDRLGVKLLLETKVMSLVLEEDETDAGQANEKQASGKQGNGKQAGEKQAGGKQGMGKRAAGVQIKEERTGQERTLRADAVIIASGGLSYPSTGATGDGYLFAAQAGHSLTETRPALVPFETKEEWVRQLQGLSLRNIQVKIRRDGRILWDEFGEMLFTHFGVSGPVLLSASSVVGKKLPAVLEIDLKPALTEEQLDKRILRDFAQAPNRQLKNALSGLYPASLIPVVIREAGLDAEKAVHDVTAAERRRLLAVTKGLTLTLTGLRGFNEAIITQGGVSVKEIKAGTMESKKVKDLYFAGEVLDVDAFTGGFNLQIAWSTGWLAGKSAAEI